MYGGSHRKAAFIAESCNLSRPLKQLVLQLHYKCPALVFPGADIALAASNLALSLIHHFRQNHSLQPHQQMHPRSSSTATAALAAIAAAASGTEDASIELLALDRVYIHASIWQDLLQALAHRYDISLFSLTSIAYLLCICAPSPHLQPTFLYNRLKPELLSSDLCLGGNSDN